jgi:hypothetical protein
MWASGRGAPGHHLLSSPIFTWSKSRANNRRSGTQCPRIDLSADAYVSREVFLDEVNATPLTIAKRTRAVRWVGTRQAHAYLLFKDHLNSRSLCGREELARGLRVAMDSGNPKCPDCLWLHARA